MVVVGSRGSVQGPQTWATLGGVLGPLPLISSPVK